MVCLESATVIVTPKILIRVQNTREHRFFFILFCNWSLYCSNVKPGCKRRWWATYRCWRSLLLFLTFSLTINGSPLSFFLRLHLGCSRNIPHPPIFLPRKNRSGDTECRPSAVPLPASVQDFHSNTMLVNIAMCAHPLKVTYLLKVILFFSVTVMNPVLLCQFKYLCKAIMLYLWQLTIVGGLNWLYIIHKRCAWINVSTAMFAVLLWQMC